MSVFEPAPRSAGALQASASAARAGLQAPLRVLLRLPNWIGDAVQCEPVLRALQAQAGFELSLAAPPKVLALFDGTLPRALRLPVGANLARDVSTWRGHELALLFTNSFASAWCAWRAGIPRRVGWSRDLRAWLLTERMAPALERGAAVDGRGRSAGWPRRLPRPFAQSAIELAQLAGIQVRETRPTLAPGALGLAAASARRAELGLATGTPYALLTVGARRVSAKGVPVWLWSRVLQQLQDSSALVALLCAAPGEQDSLEALRQALPEALRARARFAADVAIPELLALAQAARMVVSADGGARHLCAAAGARVLVLHGPTDARHSASDFDPRLLVEARVDCGPCHREQCPLSGAAFLACWRSLDPGPAVEAALRG